MLQIKGIDLTGEKFGRLTVIKNVGVDKKSRLKLWLCECECGNMKITKTSYLTSGDTTSCGCYRKECELKNLGEFWGKLKTHGLHNARIYRIWADMKERCNNKNNKAFKHYGNRGIKVCEEWQKNFMYFYIWAIHNGYEDTLTIDRIDVNKGYEPDNCRWVNWKEQANNKRTTRKLTIFGETKTAYQFEKQYGINSKLLVDRYDRGYRNEKLLYNGNLNHFRKCINKRDSKGRFIKNEVSTVRAGYVKNVG